MAEKGKKEQHVEMKQQFPNDELIKEAQPEDRDKVLFEDPQYGIMIWAEEDGDQKLILMMIENTTIRFTEAQFYSLTKATQVATKKLIGID
jgi:hypothetical protein